MKICVLFHEREAHATSAPYLIWPMCDIWRSTGHEVALQYGPNSPLDADLVLPHIDLTVLPVPYVAALAGHPRVVNRNVTDASKTLITRNRVRAPGDWDGPVIVKTVCNSGGHPERRLRRATLFGRLQDALMARRDSLSLAHARSLNPETYPIYPSAQDVPAGVYRNPALFVERFLPEHDGGLYCVRTYTFLGDHSYCERLMSDRPLVKRPYLVGREPVEVDPSVVARRREMGYDYGKFDYVVHDGEAVLLDVNRTPSVPSDDLQSRAEMLAGGIETFFR
jgi:hypothetical protein